MPDTGLTDARAWRSAGDGSLAAFSSRELDEREPSPPAQLSVALSRLHITDMATHRATPTHQATPTATPLLTRTGTYPLTRTAMLPLIMRRLTITGTRRRIIATGKRFVGGSDAVLVIDDTAVPKKGTHSVGVAAQYASALGKNANWRHWSQ